MTIYTEVRGIERSSYKPFCIWGLPIDDFLPGLKPFQFPGFLCPKPFRVFNGTVINFQIFFEGPIGGTKS
jgi:hypothetical protein